MRVFGLLLVFSSLCASTAFAQRDSLPQTAPTTQVAQEKAPDTVSQRLIQKILSNKYPNPERAAALSLVIPGAGQLYNKRLWYIKVPVIYAGYAALISSGEFNRGLKNDFEDALKLAVENKPHEFSNTQFSSVEQLRLRRDQFSKRYQLSYIGLVVFHLIQTLEAYTTAHLLDFDVDDSLSLSPTLMPPSIGRRGSGFGNGTVPGLRLSYALGR